MKSEVQKEWEKTYHVKKHRNFNNFKWILIFIILILITIGVLYYSHMKGINHFIFPGI